MLSLLHCVVSHWKWRSTTLRFTILCTRGVLMCVCTFVMFIIWIVLIWTIRLTTSTQRETWKQCHEPGQTHGFYLLSLFDMTRGTAGRALGITWILNSYIISFFVMIKQEIYFGFVVMVLQRCSSCFTAKNFKYKSCQHLYYIFISCLLLPSIISQHHMLAIFVGLFHAKCAKNNEKIIYKVYSFDWFSHYVMYLLLIYATGGHTGMVRDDIRRSPVHHRVTVWRQRMIQTDI